jgi:dTDP-4-dehydrorhamnose reductase
MMKLEREQANVSVVNDQRGQPTSAEAVAERIITMVAANVPAGIYHATCSGEATWYELAREVFRLLGANPARVKATTSDAYVRPARRPQYSVLGHDGWAQVGLAPLAHWRSALSDAFPGLLAAAERERSLRRWRSSRPSWRPLMAHALAIVR